MNNFGGFAGGAVWIPHLYNGHDKTFFFGSYEGLRLPRQFPLVESFPSADMRNGNLWNYLSATAGDEPRLPINNYDGTPIPCTGPSQLLGSRIPGSGQRDQVPDAGAEYRQRRLFPEQLCRQLPGADFEQPVRRADRPEYYFEPVDLWAVYVEEPIGHHMPPRRVALASARPASLRCWAGSISRSRTGA